MKYLNHTRGTIIRSSFLLLVLMLSGCATAPMIQPEVNSLVVANRSHLALNVLGNDEEAYGDENVLLYWFDKGMAYHLTEDYVNSIRAFAQAQRVMDKMYTKSLSKAFATLLVNDYSQYYRGESYEYTLVNVFQAMNYLMLGQADEAAVEARDFDYRMRVLQQLYEGKDAYYTDDPFVRTFMGLVYESAGGRANLNDAAISYAKAYELYASMNESEVDWSIPSMLEDNLGAVSKRFNLPHSSLASRGPSWQEREGLARLIVVEYAGFSPLKVPASLVLPVDRQSTVSISVPTLNNRVYENVRSQVVLETDFGVQESQQLHLGHRVSDVAHQVYKQKRVWLTTKSIIRPITKYLIQRAARKKMAEKNGQTSGDILNIMFNTYNMYSEQADLRAWQTLPNEIRLAQLWVKPGQYTVTLKGFDESGQQVDSHQWLSKTLKAGQTHWLVNRSYR